MTKRKPKKSDQKNIENAYQILKKAMKDHPEVESTLWAGACWSALVNGYLASGVSYDDFCKEVEGVKGHYRVWWENDQ